MHGIIQVAKTPKNKLCSYYILTAHYFNLSIADTFLQPGKSTTDKMGWLPIYGPVITSKYTA